MQNNAKDIIAQIDLVNTPTSDLLAVSDVLHATTVARDIGNVVSEPTQEDLDNAHVTFTSYVGEYADDSEQVLAIMSQLANAVNTAG